MKFSSYSASHANSNVPRFSIATRINTVFGLIIVNSHAKVIPEVPNFVLVSVQAVIEIFRQHVRRSGYLYAITKKLVCNQIGN